MTRLPGRRRADAAILLGLAVAVGLAGLAVAAKGPAQREVGFVERFDEPDGLLINERAGRDRVDRWRITSGSLFIDRGTAWTGPPDRDRPDVASAQATNSAVFRLVSNDATFGNVAVDARFQVRSRLDRHVSDYDGAHLLLRYQSPDRLYAVALHRRDGLVMIKRKSPGGQTTYETLAEAAHDTVLGRWFEVSAEVVNVDAGVLVRVAIDDEPVLTVVDRSPAAITGPGAIGIRLDNVDARFDDIVARPLLHAA